MAQERDERAGPWNPGSLRLFIGHTHAHRELAGELKGVLLGYGIDAFVAHDDIEPGREWENEIIAALRSCNALVVLLSEDAHESEWVDQESGWAMGRDVPVLSVNLGRTPYGFLGRYQALPGVGRTAAAIAERIFETLRSNHRTAWTVVEGLVTSFVGSESFNQANTRFWRLSQIPLLGVSEEQLDRLEAAYRENSQVAGAWDVQRNLEALLQRHREAWAEFWEQEKQDREDHDQ